MPTVTGLYSPVALDSGACATQLPQVTLKTKITLLI